MESELYDFYGWTPYWGFGGGLGDPLLAGPVVLATPPPVAAPPHEPATGDPHLRSVDEVTGYAIEALDGDLGHAVDFLIEDRSWALRYLVAETGGWWHGHKVLVSKGWISNIDWGGRRLGIDLSREQLRAAPPYDPSVPLGRDDEVLLHDQLARSGYWA
jgi:hypothetical protein